MQLPRIRLSQTRFIARLEQVITQRLESLPLFTNGNLIQTPTMISTFLPLSALIVSSRKTLRPLSQDLTTYNRLNFGSLLAHFLNVLV
jgi:hypothetical protein